MGSPITFKAKATGGPAPLQYRFYRLNRQTNAWTLVRDYSPVDTYTWTPIAGEQGSYTIQVWVRGAGSTAAYDSCRSSDTFAIADAPPNIAIVKTETSFPAATGAPITWKAVASGGPGPLEYRFYRFARATNTWTLVQDYGPSNTYTWTPGASDAGHAMSLQAWVRRAGTTVANDAWSSTPDFPDRELRCRDSQHYVRCRRAHARPARRSRGRLPPEAAQARFSTSSGFTACARDSWSMVKDFSASQHVHLDTGTGDAGTYQLQVAMRKAGSTAAAAFGDHDVRSTSWSTRMPPSCPS